MITAWTEHLKDPDEKQRFEDGLRHAKWIFDRQRELLKAVENGLDRQEISPKAYDSPNWSYRQAHSNGYRQCLNDMRTIINLDPKEHK